MGRLCEALGRQYDQSSWRGAHGLLKKLRQPSKLVGGMLNGRYAFFLPNQLLHPGYLPFMVLQIYAGANSLKLFRTLKLRSVASLSESQTKPRDFW